MTEGLVIDMFAGGGGASEGMREALGREVDIAVNHDLKALMMHAVNHPGALHLEEDVFTVRLDEYCKGRHVSLMWASPDCFTAGHLVWTNDGYKPIEDVRPKDYVLTHKGRMRMVTRFVKKSTYDLYEIKIAGCETQTVTPEHPYYARKKSHTGGRVTLGEAEWVKAEELSNEYKVGIPINSESIVPTWNGTVKEVHNQYGITTAIYVNELGRLMSNEDFWWVVGRYIGDGCLTESKCMVEICCAKDEDGEIRPHLDSTGIRYTERDKRTTHAFTISSKEMCDFLGQFGAGAVNKSITPTILNLPIELLRAFLEGYISADGSWITKYEYPECNITTVSRNLAYGIQQCILKAYGTYGCIYVRENNCSVIEGRKVHTLPAYSIHFRIERKWAKFTIEDGMAWVNVSKVKQAKQGHYSSVYTLSVEEDESFTVGNVAVHNCTHFSRARGGKPRSQHVRMLPWAVFEQSRRVMPDVVVCENVAEIQTWEDYGAFVDSMRGLGYTFECRELVAADYGARTSRRRWYAVFRRDGCKTEWPMPNHKEPGTVLAPHLPAWLSARPCIDLEDMGEDVKRRSRPLSANTLGRMERGFRAFGNQWLMSYYGTGVGQSLDMPLRTITCKDRFALVTRRRGRSYLRMLRPDELKLAQGFPASYVIDRYSDGTSVPKAEQVRRIGNSVVPLMARCIVAANVWGGRTCWNKTAMGA